MNKIIAIVAMTVALSACNQQQPVPVDANGVPQAVQQQGGFDAGSAAIGAVGGAVLGHMMTKNSQANHPRTIVVERPTYARSPYYGGRSSSVVTRTTTVKKSMFGNKVTRTTTTRRR